MHQAIAYALMVLLLHVCQAGSRFQLGTYRRNQYGRNRPDHSLRSAGFDVLTAMEKVPVDGDDRPQQEIKITGASVFVNPYKEMEAEEQKRAEAERKQASHAAALSAFSPSVLNPLLKIFVDVLVHWQG